MCWAQFFCADGRLRPLKISLAIVGYYGFIAGHTTWLLYTWFMDGDSIVIACNICFDAVRHISVSCLQTFVNWDGCLFLNETQDCGGIFV